jgi:hypothetical protein
MTMGSGVLGALAIAAGLVVVGAGAPRAARAQADACAGLEGKARLQCKYDRFAAEASRAATALADAPGAGVTEEQRGSLRAAAARVDRERGRVARTGGLETQAAKRRVKCLPRECDPEQFPPADPAAAPLCRPVDGDGICEEGEDCLEVVGDGVGDDVQPCVAGEVCATVCDGRAAEAEENVDPAAVAELETVYDDLTATAADVNDTLPGIAAASARVRTLSGSADPCAEQAAATRWSATLRVSAVVSAATSRGVTDIAERFCDQSSAGFALGSACVAGESLTFAVELFKATVELASGSVDQLVLDATLGCARQALASAGDLADAIAVASQAVARIEGKQAYIIELLETAQGRRPGFPAP